jgi:hypothetical protein
MAFSRLAPLVGLWRFRRPAEFQSPSDREVAAGEALA